MNGFEGRVLVTEGENRGVLAACRSLSEAGYEVTAVAGRRAAAALASRACRSSFVLVDLGEHPARFVADLRALVTRRRFDALLPGGDRSLHLISEARSALEPHVALGLPDRAAVQRSLDKFVLLEASGAAGVAAPPTRVCESPSDARRALRDLGPAVVVKPSSSVLEHGGSLRQHRVQLVTRASELERVVARMSFPFIVQRFESDAKRLSCAGLMTADGLRGFVVVRFLRTWPPLTGAVCFGETVRSPDGLRERVEHLLGAVGWRGIFELELLDLGHDRLAAIDLNPRIFGWLALAIAAGADLPRLWVRSLAGAGLPSVEPRIGVRYRWEEAELAHLFWQIRRRQVRAAGRVVVPHRRVVHAHFRLRDPAPLGARLLGLAQRRLRVG